MSWSTKWLPGLAVALLLNGAPPVYAQQQLAQAAPKRALNIPPKPVPADEAEREGRINGWTIGLAGGLLEGSFVRYAADLATALDDGDNLRILPIVSYGAVGNVTDLVYLKGVDLAITYADALDYFKNVDKIPNITQRVNYITPLFQGEVHIYARPEIKSLKDLAGKKVNFNTVGSAANYTGGIVFDRLKVNVERVFMNNSLALEGMQSGEIAALVHVVAKPNSLFTQLKSVNGFHFLPVEFTDAFKDYYVPADLTAADYPQIIQKDQPVRTISVPALLAVYNWRPESDRFRRTQRFVEYLFERFDKLRSPPFQPGWREINIAGTVPGWTRFQPAQAWLNNLAARSKPSPKTLDTQLARAQAARAAPSDTAEQEQLFQQFLEWTKKQKH